MPKNTVINPFHLENYNRILVLAELLAKEMRKGAEAAPEDECKIKLLQAGVTILQTARSVLTHTP